MARPTPTIIAAAVVLACTAPALAQAIDIFADIPSQPGETATITLGARFDGAADYAMAGIATSLVHTSMRGQFFLDGQRLVAPMDGPGTSAGMATGSSYDGIIAGQLNFPPAGIFADPTNPIAFWQVDYSFEFDPRGGPAVLDLRTLTTRFDVYVDRDSGTSESRLDGLVEGEGQVVIFPAPGTGIALLGGLALALRRRR